MTAGLRVAIVTVSDRASRGEREDLSGPALEAAVRESGGEVIGRTVVPDERDAIAAELTRLADDVHAPLILTTGGTGFAPRDVTPEATRAVLHKEAPGLAEHARADGARRTRHAILSRGVAGIRHSSLIVNLPGSPKGARETFDAILPVLPHALSVLAGSGDEHPAA
jgi:molybdenum cofactor synthesis domain-containing protein